MPDESDGIEEALAGTVRLAVTAGARLGSELARAREERMREQRRLDERDASRLAQRFEAEKQVAVAELSKVYRPDWWERADADRIGQAYATARAWAPEAQEAAQGERKMREELLARYGIDVDRVNPRGMSVEVERWRQRLAEQRRQEADRQRTAAGAERVEAAALLEQAARENRGADAARDDGRRDAQANEAGNNPWLIPGQASRGVGAATTEGARLEDRERDSTARAGQAAAETERVYDSAERRAADARAMEAQGVEPGVAQSRMRADTGRATPPTLATASGGRDRAPKARKAVNRSAQVERAGVER